MAPKEFQKSHLAIELRAGKKRLEDLLHGLSDEQCETAAATRSGSVIDLLSEIVTKEFVALMEVSHRPASLPTNSFPNADGRTPAASGVDEDEGDKSVKNLLAEFEILRSAVIRGVQDGGSNTLKVDTKYAYVDDLCVVRFNQKLDEIESWRGREIVGFSAMRLRAEACEAELNQAIVDLSREDFLAGNLDLRSLFSMLFDRFYSEDFVWWFKTEEVIGRTATFQRMADLLEFINTLLEMGLASIESFRTTASTQDAEGNFVTDWEAVFGGKYLAGRAVRWRAIRAWNGRKVIAERIVDLP